MPRRRQHPSLRQAGLLSIVSNFESFWCAWTAINSVEDREKSDVFTPFQYLDDDMIQEIIDMLDRRHLLCPNHFQLLLHPNIRRINLGEIDLRSDLSTVIKTVGIKCQKLTNLNLGNRRITNARYIDSKLLLKLLTNLPQLISLDLAFTKLDADAMETISKTCPNLFDLNIADCGLEDTAFKHLCKPSKHHNVLPKLRKLSTNLSELSGNTVVNILESYRSLRDLGGGINIDHAFNLMYGEEFQLSKQVSPQWIHNLLKICIFGDSKREFKLSEADRLDLTFQCCPFATKLTVWDVEDHESLNKISQLKHLKTLAVSLKGNPDFSASMVPLLSNIGNNLTSLTFGYFNAVSLILIGKSCVNLESLDLFRCNIMTEHHLLNDTDRLLYFTKLNVIILNYLDNDIDANLLSLMLQNASELREIKLQKVETLTDGIISDANRKHGFRHLRKFDIFKCSSITIKSIWDILSSDNPLKKLLVSQCDNITDEDMELVRHDANLR